jgi:acetyl esterase/lipase
VVVYIHGGGFVGGDKRSVQPGLLKECLESGISVAAIHYRFVTTHPFPAPQHDGARAIQFLRSKAGEWNIDTKGIAAYGGSAGAGISLWLAFHDEVADPKSDDPVARESSRLSAAGSFGGQTSYDPHVIREWIGGRAHEHPSIYKCYSVETLDQLDDPKLQKLYDEVSAIKHLTRDDPPVFMFYSEPYGPLPDDARPGQGIHHPTFGLKLKAAMDKLGIESVNLHRSEFEGDPHAEMLKFFRKQFGMARGE